MTDHDTLLKELDAALQVEPSSAFPDGVRARVRRSRVRTIQIWCGLAAAACVGFAVMSLSRPAHEVPVQVTAPLDAPVPSIVKAASAPTSGGQVFGPGKASAVRASTKASEPRLEVITNQGAVLRQIWAGVDDKVLPFAETEATPSADTPAGRPIVVNPLTVPPIVVSEIGKEPGSGGATPIIRRADATKETQ